jgi:hypothetical protein
MELTRTGKRKAERRTAVIKSTKEWTITMAIAGLLGGFGVICMSIGFHIGNL